MAATTALRLGETIGCSSTDSNIETIDILREDSSPITNDYWSPESSGEFQSVASTPTFVRHRPISCQQRFKLIQEGDIHVCRLDHRRTIYSKIMNSKYLRRWESHHIFLGANEIESSMVRKNDTLLFTLCILASQTILWQQRLNIHIYICIYSQFTHNVSNFFGLLPIKRPHLIECPIKAFTNVV